MQEHKLMLGLSYITLMKMGAVHMLHAYELIEIMNMHGEMMTKLDYFTLVSMIFLGVPIALFRILYNTYVNI
ncbi:hypothetical protein HMI01_01610 [Halolactibacillus miurensis]|uniref:Uncharacterized protein n=1 Tax=Halolactibacillus miurensis TaxID=306541 RepID=A0A1I6P212_9BACI|nr:MULTISPECIES: hypothetical protein [Halolactibacillus]GEM03173.1 hypothetical protein HMI01_01610 [Halolactibacillus miurensis]SFS34221.1 hypothetical protein SAMN05421668_101147 [Halolactibacillus miurensis]